MRDAGPTHLAAAQAHNVDVVAGGIVAVLWPCGRRGGRAVATVADACMTGAKVCRGRVVVVGIAVTSVNVEVVAHEAAIILYREPHAHGVQPANVLRILELRTLQGICRALGGGLARLAVLPLHVCSAAGISALSAAQLRPGALVLGKLLLSG